MHSLQCPVSITADGINTKDQARRTVLITYVPHWRNAGTLSSSIHFTRHPFEPNLEVPAINKDAACGGEHRKANALLLIRFLCRPSPRCWIVVHPREEGTKIPLISFFCVGRVHSGGTKR